MPITKELHTKFKKAEPLTDGELSELFHYYDTLRRSFSGFTPPEYRLIEDDINKHYRFLADATAARLNHKLRHPRPRLPMN